MHRVCTVFAPAVHRIMNKINLALARLHTDLAAGAHQCTPDAPPAPAHICVRFEHRNAASDLRVRGIELVVTVPLPNRLMLVAAGENDRVAVGDVALRAPIPEPVHERWWAEDTDRALKGAAVVIQKADKVGDRSGQPIHACGGAAEARPVDCGRRGSRAGSARWQARHARP